MHSQLDKNSVSLILDEPAMLDYAGQFITACGKPPQIIYLDGNLGAGKTTFVRGVLKALGYQGHVKSPTYNIVESYEIQYDGALAYLNHFDFYRINSPEELTYLGIEEYFQDNTLTFIEWHEKGEGCIPSPNIIISFTIQENQRQLSLTFRTKNP